MPLFVSCPPKLEPLLLEELNELGFSNCRIGFQGIFVDDMSMEAIYRINYSSRLASRVLLPLKQFRCRDKLALYKAVSEIEWAKYLKKGMTLAIDSNVHHRSLTNSLFAAQIAKDAICDQLRKVVGWRPSIDLKAPDLQLNLHIHQEMGTLSFDTSGQSLHKRGYRLEAGEAPLQESMAAALLRIAKFTGEEVMIDPCCGSGTLLIEAALIASNTAPGFLRKEWGFMHHPDFSSIDWLKIKNKIDAQRKELLSKKIIGCEINANVARICRSNVKAAGVLKGVEVLRQDFSDFHTSEAPTFLISNPPHGKRLMDIDSLRPLYRRLGNFMKQHMYKPSRGFLFIGNLELTKEVGLAAKKRHVISNSGTDSRLLEFDIF